MTRRRRILPILLAAGFAVVASSSTMAQVAKKAAGQAETRDSVNAKYVALRIELEKRHVADLAKVAASETGPTADATYRELFHLVIAHDLYREAEPAAEAVIKADQTAPDVEGLAHLINVIAEVDKGQPEESLTHLKEFIQHRAKVDESQRLDADTVLAIGEAYFQRLVHAGRFDIARQAAQLVVDNTKNKTIKDHFSARLDRLNRVGKPAPAIAGNDIDGKPVKLTDYKGKVVLVDFWATWCPPCGPQMMRYNALSDKYGAQGLVVLGINEDSQGAGAAAKAEEVAKEVRRYLIGHHVGFPSVVDVVGDKSISDAYGVNDIPASFLIGRDGSIVAFELSGADLERAVIEALKKK